MAAWYIFVGFANGSLSTRQFFNSSDNWLAGNEEAGEIGNGHEAFIGQRWRDRGRCRARASKSRNHDVWRRVASL